MAVDENVQALIDKIAPSIPQVVTIDSRGVTLMQFQDILEAMQNIYRQIYGQDIYIDYDSSDGQLIAIFALAMYNAGQVAVDVYQSFSPFTAQGAGLSRLVPINGITRKSATASSADVLIKGTPGTVITNGVVEGAGQKWNLPARVVIGGNGEILTSATCQVLGNIVALPNTITKITNPTKGWTSVTNPQAATQGAAVESDLELRQRQQQSVALPSSTVMEGIEAGIANIEGVTQVKGYENDTDAVNDHGIPAYSLCLVVLGGDAQQIARIYADKKTPGIPTYGNTEVEFVNSRGELDTLYIERPTISPIYVSIKLIAKTGYLSTTGEQIKQNIVEYINGIKMGETVYFYNLYAPILAAEPIQGINTFDIEFLLIGKDPDDLKAGNILLKFNELATCTTDNIALEVPAS